MLDKIRESIEGPLLEHGITIDEIRIVIDKQVVVDLDTCVEATHIINDILDEIDVIEESYILDISSKEKGGN